jgi:lipopolysaccharide transport system ATP-binding protein
MTPIIEIKGISKSYELGPSRSHPDNLREALRRGVQKLIPRMKSGTDGEKNSRMLWALRDVTFNVMENDVVGIIGANGAGKSTLLKILSRITEPTAGQIRMKGRLASLLEVGTGFHAELTGRENIFLNGALLGMGKAEIQAKFDEIVAFAEIERFLDTPVKHYSSGMYVRLGFAVAAHLDPDILVVDEVLAVGDVAFQKKCMGKMNDLRHGGRTVLFVSHNMASVESLCRTGVVLRQGQVQFTGGAQEAVSYYIQTVYGDSGTPSTHSADLKNAPGRHAKYSSWLRRAEIWFGEGETFRGCVPVGAPMRFHLRFELPKNSENFDVRVNFFSFVGQQVAAARSSYERNRNWGIRSGEVELVCEIPSLPLTPGEYRIDLALVAGHEVLDYVEGAFPLTVVGGDYYGNGNHNFIGVFVLPQRWYIL